jgi:hypothetical protein
MSSVPKSPLPIQLLNQLKCPISGCAGFLEMPESVLQEEAAYLYATAKDKPYIAVLCDQCKHAMPYSVRRFRESGRTHNLGSADCSQLSLFCVSLECENKSCDIRTTVYAPKRPTAIEPDVKSELKLWTLGRIRCRCGALVRVQKSTEPQRIQFGDGSGESLTH